MMYRTFFSTLILIVALIGVAPERASALNCSNSSTCPASQSCNTSGVCAPLNCVAPRIIVNHACQAAGSADPSTVGGNNTGSADVVGANQGNQGVDELTNPLNGINDLPSLLNAILTAVVELGAILVTVMLIYCGFLFVAAQGNEEKIKNARSALMWTLIGGLILLGATAISAVIQATAQSLSATP